MINQKYIIYLRCEETNGYFTNIIITSSDRQVGVHPYKDRAYKFNSRNEAFVTAKSLKANYKCIISYEVVSA